MKALCVYCGSSSGNLPLYADGARGMAEALVERNLGLVYGGGKVGLMGTIADEVLRLGGQVTGVIPTALLEMEVGHRGLTQLHVVANMHERKALMAELSDGFIAMPGGIGTLEELFEVTTWAQLHLHDKPIGILNIGGYYDALLKFVQQMSNQGFLKPRHASLMMVESDAHQLLDRFAVFETNLSHPLLNRVRAEG